MQFAYAVEQVRREDERDLAAARPRKRQQAAQVARRGCVRLLRVDELDGVRAEVVAGARGLRHDAVGTRLAVGGLDGEPEFGVVGREERLALEHVHEVHLRGRCGAGTLSENSVRCVARMTHLLRARR